MHNHSEMVLCKDCEHCSPPQRVGLYTDPEIRLESAYCLRSGRVSYVTGQRIDLEQCQDKRSRSGNPNACADFSFKRPDVIEYTL